MHRSDRHCELIDHCRIDFCCYNTEVCIIDLLDTGDIRCGLACSYTCACVITEVREEVVNCGACILGINHSGDIAAICFLKGCCEAFS